MIYDLGNDIGNDIDNDIGNILHHSMQLDNVL